jgi:hypothetical protein
MTSSTNFLYCLVRHSFLSHDISSAVYINYERAETGNVIFSTLQNSISLGKYGAL